MSEELEDVAVDTNTEVVEATNSNETVEEESTDLTVELAKEQEARKQLTARAIRAEKELKELRKLKETTPQPQINSNPQLSDELKLIARGLSDEEIEQAKIVAKGRDISLTEAIKDPLFLSHQATLKEKQRKENAKLGASKGSGESQDTTLIKEGMSREEHEKAFKKVMGQ